MKIFKSMFIAAAGLKAQSARMRIIAENLANSSSTPLAPGQEPYRRQIPAFKSVMDRELGVSVVTMDKAVADKAPFGKKFDPGHPAADETGYVQPTKAQLREARGENSVYHNNCIQTWHVKENGEAENVEVS